MFGLTSDRILKTFCIGLPRTTAFSDVLFADRELGLDAARFADVGHFGQPVGCSGHVATQP